MFTMLLTEAGNLLGNVLYAGGPTSGDCVIRSLPARPEDLHRPESDHLYSLQQLGEFAWRREGDKLTIQSDEGVEIATIADGYMISGAYRICVDHKDD